MIITNIEREEAGIKDDQKTVCQNTKLIDGLKEKNEQLNLKIKQRTAMISKFKDEKTNMDRGHEISQSNRRVASKETDTCSDGRVGKCDLCGPILCGVIFCRECQHESWAGVANEVTLFLYKHPRE